MSKPRKAFRTSPSVRIPRAAVERLQETKQQAQAQAQAQAQEIKELKGSVRLAYRKGLADGISACLDPSNDPHWPEDYVEAIEWWALFVARDAVHLAALRDLVKFFDKVSGSYGSWVVAEVKRIEAIRLLSIGV